MHVHLLVMLVFYGVAFPVGFICKIILDGFIDGWELNKGSSLTKKLIEMRQTTEAEQR